MTQVQTALVEAALAWRGTPYRHQASLNGIGCDCLGLVRGIWRDVYGAEPETMPAYPRLVRDRAGAQALLAAACRHFRRVEGLAPEAGMLGLFRLGTRLPVRHCGVFVAPDHFIHAQEHLGVIVVPFDTDWRRRLVQLHAFPEKA